jgi:hypothetical protein
MFAALFSFRIAGLMAVSVFLVSNVAFGQSARTPTIAVTELSYEQSVRSHFNYFQSEMRAGLNASPAFVNVEASASLAKASGDIIQITRGEMHQFTGDIKGGLLKSGQYKLVQGRPWTKSDTTTLTAACIPPKCDGAPTTFSENVTLFDVIDRIKKGYYAGADYVLFGTVSNIDSRNDELPIQGSNAVNRVYSIDLACEFSLINTKNYAVVAAFSALGQGSDSRLVNSSAAVMNPNKPRVVRDVSRSLGDDVTSQMLAQFSQIRELPKGSNQVPPSDKNSSDGKVTEYR